MVLGRWCIHECSAPKCSQVLSLIRTDGGSLWRQPIVSPAGTQVVHQQDLLCLRMGEHTVTGRRKPHAKPLNFGAPVGPRGAEQRSIGARTLSLGWTRDYVCNPRKKNKMLWLSTEGETQQTDSLAESRWCFLWEVVCIVSCNHNFLGTREVRRNFSNLKFICPRRRPLSVIIVIVVIKSARTIIIFIFIIEILFSIIINMIILIL